MNNVFHFADCCRACLKVEGTLTSTTAVDTDTIKLCDKLMCCIAEVVSFVKYKLQLCTYIPNILDLDERHFSNFYMQHLY